MIPSERAVSAMKINEAEQRVGISRRNIRFYEKEGLLAPGRDSSNGYRSYTEEDVNVLLQIKLLRKLDLPLEEIRALQQGLLTVPDVMARHVIQLERRRGDLETTIALCRELEQEKPPLSALDAAHWLSVVEEREKEGTRFVNVKKKDAHAKYAGAVIAALVMAALMGGIVALFIWAYATDPANSPPMGIVILLAAIPMTVIIGVFIALWQRIKQIKGGEEDAASQY